MESMIDYLRINALSWGDHRRLGFEMGRQRSQMWVTSSMLYSEDIRVHNFYDAL